jgi:DNA invertase Pin-like site-specific DNA recombinase
VREELLPGRNEQAQGQLIRAAQSVRMSTEHQKYSTENQGEAIQRYAAARGIEIIKTYADQGKSGLSLDGRAALKQLIDDVQANKADFDTILVYDISRWGRFQDADEHAYYEYVCKRAGIAVQYCAEQFENDGSPVSTIVKGVKRAMAGEYSRELSVKVFSGQCRLIEMGYRQGGPPGYGLRRNLVDESGTSKGVLARGEQKSIQTDRVVLVRAYELVGFTPDRDYSYIQINRTLRLLHPQIVVDAIRGIEKAGGLVEQDNETDLLVINGEFTASIVVVRCHTTPAGSLRWHVRFDTGLWPDITVAIRMDQRLLAAKRLVEQRQRRGKGLQINGVDNRKRRPLSSTALIRAYQEDVDRKRLLIRKAESTRNRLVFVTEALRKLFGDENFVTLLRAEGLETLPGRRI